jgi:lipopolysaccharide/colanic/teichoic acid biosynthesis glycosyltransferase
MLKRAFDVLVTVLAMPIWLPLVGIVALVVRMRLGSPVFFRQARGGLGGGVIQILKFRTMTDDRGADGSLLQDAQRLTRLGRLLRSSSLDELPSLFNVLRGDLSLVGPRPLIADYLPLYTAHQMRRHEVRPGITGWAQVQGRNALTWEQKFELDVWYVDHRSWTLDLKILLLTVRKVVSAEGVNAGAEVTMPRFRGSHGPSVDVGQIPG